MPQSISHSESHEHPASQAAGVASHAHTATSSAVSSANTLGAEAPIKIPITASRASMGVGELLGSCQRTRRNVLVSLSCELDRLPCPRVLTQVIGLLS